MAAKGYTCDVCPWNVFFLIAVALLLGATVMATIILIKRSLIGSRLYPENEKEGKENRNEKSRGSRPKVQVTGPKVKPLICQICLGRVKQDMEYVKCSCGKSFHSTCISRTGYCPYCECHYTTRDGRTPSENGFITLRTPNSEKMTAPITGTKVNYILCPLCGANVPAGAGTCECGAIFVEEGGRFKCPECGTSISEDESGCRNCGERFDHLDTQTCPLCKRILPQGEEVCECGALIGDSCPECGNELAASESTCRNCGVVFELI